MKLTMLFLQCALSGAVLIVSGYRPDEWQFWAIAVLLLAFSIVSQLYRTAVIDDDLLDELRGWR